MSQYIGNVEITTINEIENNGTKNVQEIDTLEQSKPRVTELAPTLESLTITATLVKNLHSESLSPEEQKVQIESLTQNDVGENTFDYMEYRGYLSVENVDTPRSGESPTIAEAVITAIYLPETVYSSVLGIVSTPPNDFNIKRGGYIPIDSSVTSPSISSNVSKRKLPLRNTVSVDNVEYATFPKFIKSENKDTISRKSTRMYKSDGFEGTVEVIPEGKYRLFLRGTGNTVTIFNKNDEQLYELEVENNYTDTFYLNTQTNLSVEVEGEVDGVVLIPAHWKRRVSLRHTNLKTGELNDGIKVRDDGKLITSINTKVKNPVIDNGMWTFEPESGLFSGTGPDAQLDIPDIYVFDKICTRMSILNSTNYKMYIKRKYPMLEMSGQIPETTIDVSDADFITGVLADGGYHNFDNWVVAIDGSGCLVVASNRKDTLTINDGEIGVSGGNVLALGYSHVGNLYSTATPYTVNLPEGIYIAFTDGESLTVRDSDTESVILGDERQEGDYFSAVVETAGETTLNADIASEIGLIPISLNNSIGVQDIAHESMSVTKQNQGVITHG